MRACLLMLILVAMSRHVSAALRGSPDAIGSTYAKVRNLIPSHSVFITSSVSSSLFTETNVESDIKCMMLCAMRDCSVASRNEHTGLCQLLVLNDAIQAAALSNSYVQRLVGGEAGDHVWKVPGFSQLITEHRYTVRLFNNTGTGRTGSMQSYMVHTPGCYRIQALGARGGTLGKPGGNGAMVSGIFNLAFGTQLTIVAGQQGGVGGGGGGSFVYRSSDNRLLLAAGGGGGGSNNSAGHPGQKGPAGTDTTPCGFCNAAYKGFGGANGLAGVINMAAASSDYRIGGAGAGWVGKSTVGRRSIEDGESGGSRADGWVGGQGSKDALFGGFGGGGGSGKDRNGVSGGGGGGGFSGGGTAVGSFQPGGGGGSFCGGGECSGTTGGNTGNVHGSVALVMNTQSCA